MKTGMRLATLLSLTTAFTFPFCASAQEADLDAIVQDQAPQSEPEEELDVSIPGGGIIVTGRRDRDPTRAASQVISVLSQEQIARTGEGDIAGALSRVTGLSVQGQGFVFVRGLGDRYSLALLNGLPLPSPQPLSRVVPLDIFPTSVISSSLVQKTYSANFPGEFGGGVINLTTRALPDESFLTIGGGVSGNTVTTFSNGLSYFGSPTDWTGFDNGTRDRPDSLNAFLGSRRQISDLSGEEQRAIAKDLVNPNLIVLQRIGNVPANWSANITAGTAKDVGSTRLGVLATGSISNDWRTRNVFRQTVFGNFEAGQNTNETITDNRITVNALVSLGAEFGENKIRWTNLFIRDTLKQARLGEVDDLIDTEENIEQSTGWFERQLFNSQVVGEFEFGPVSLDLRGGYAQTQREVPFEWDFTYVRNLLTSNQTGELFVNNLDRQNGSANVAFSDLEENLYYGGADLTYELTNWLNGTVGYAYTDTERFSERRQFSYFNGDGERASLFRQGVGVLRPDLLLGNAIIDGFRLLLQEPNTELDPAFLAGLRIHAAYGQLRGEPIEGLSFDLGVRYEDGRQFVNAVQVFDVNLGPPRDSLIERSYWLPSGTLTYEVADGLQVRAHASKTIARPQFRELIFQPYFDPETNRSFSGNPFLIDSQLTNLELRGEYYLGRGRSFSLAGFYKNIENPIEVVAFFNDNDQNNSFANAPKATLYGAEVEAQYAFDLFDLGGFFETKQLVVIANYTYTQSDIQVGPDDTTIDDTGTVRAASNFFQDGLPLTGQSDHLANLQLSLEDTERLQQLTFLVAYGSERVTSRAAGRAGNRLPDVVERPGVQFDAVFRQGFDFLGSEATLKLEARNIFGRRNQEFQDDGTTRFEINTFDLGTTFAGSLSLTF
jgi:TonB-dependent receptor